MKYKGHEIETLTPSKKAIIDRAMQPFDANSPGPFKASLDLMDGVVRKELITYRIVDGVMIKDEAHRTFKDNDYHDTSSYTIVKNID